MTFENGSIIHDLDGIFERMHARLHHRYEQLVRQMNIHSRKTSNTSLSFCSMNEIQLEQAIDSFGRLTISTSLNDIRRLTNPTSTPYAMHSISSRRCRPMRRTTPASTQKAENNINDDHYQIIGKHGRQKGQFSNPQDVLFINTPNKTLLVSDTINQNVQLFSLETNNCTGRFVSSSNSKQIPLRRPIGLSNTFDNNSTYFVADYDQHLISTWTIDDHGNGKLIKKFGQQSLIGPKGLCVSSQSNRIAVADNKANCVCLFDSSGSFLHRFGTRGPESHELAGPHYIQFTEQDNDRNIIVTDFYNNSVKIFDVERHGQFVTSFGSLGTKNGLFQAPTGLAIDYERGYIFVSDWGNSRVQVFDRQGTFIRIIELSSSDMLYGPQGLDYEPLSRTLAIANSGKHCVLLIHID